jgi:cell shape-determining protein MreC
MESNVESFVKEINAPHTAALASVQAMVGKVERYRISNPEIPPLDFNPEMSQALHRDTTHKVTTARDTLVARLQERLEQGIPGPYVGSDELRKNNAVAAALDITELLGPDGIALFKLAIEEEVNSIRFMDTLFLESILYESSATCTKRPMIIVAGPSGSGKSSACKKAFKTACTMDINPQSQDAGRHAIVVDGGLAREVSNIWTLIQQVSKDLGYTGVDLYSHSNKILENAKLRLRATAHASPNAGIIEPLTFADPTELRLIDQMAALPNALPIFTRIDGDKEVMRNTIEKLGRNRAHFYKPETTKLPEGKPYNEKGFSVGYRHSKLAEHYFRYQYPNSPRFIIPFSLILVTRKSIYSNWKILSGKPKPGAEVIAVSKKLFESYSQAGYLRGPPKFKEENEAEKPDDILAVQLNSKVSPKRWELVKDSVDKRTHERYLRVRRDLWEELWPKTNADTSDWRYSPPVISLEDYNKFYTTLPEMHHYLWSEVKAAVSQLQKMLLEEKEKLIQQANEQALPRLSNGDQLSTTKPYIKQLEDSLGDLSREIDTLEKLQNVSRNNNDELKKIAAKLLKIKGLPKDFKKAVEAINDAVKKTDTIIIQNTSQVISRSMLHLDIKEWNKESSSFWERHKDFRNILLGLGAFIVTVALVILATAIYAAVVAGTSGAGVAFAPVFVSALVSIVTFGGFLPATSVGIGMGLGILASVGATLFTAVSSIFGRVMHKEVEEIELAQHQQLINTWTQRQISSLTENLDLEEPLRKIKKISEMLFIEDALDARNSKDTEDDKIEVSEDEDSLPKPLQSKPVPVEPPPVKPPLPVRSLSKKIPSKPVVPFDVPDGLYEISRGPVRERGSPTSSDTEGESKALERFGMFPKTEDVPNPSLQNTPENISIKRQ